MKTLDEWLKQAEENPEDRSLVIFQAVRIIRAMADAAGDNAVMCDVILEAAEKIINE